MINIEYVQSNVSFPIFLNKIKGMKISVCFDANTRIFYEKYKAEIKECAKVKEVFFNTDDFIPDEKSLEILKQASESSNYVLAVGSGSLNDLAKAAGYDLGIPSGVLATAPSMDGYCSKGSALMINGKKITYTVNMPDDVLIDPSILCDAPRELIASGVGDILGKFTCLTDWRLSHIINGEEIDQVAYSMMEKARSECVDNFESIKNYESSGTLKLMNALVTAGLAMAECGNSRPASGSEHHMSHFLEMDFVSRDERIPPHGIKVAIGTLISMEIYHYLIDNKIQFKDFDKVEKIVNELPSIDFVKRMMIEIGCPTKFSEIGVPKKTMEAMIENAWTVRDRFTVLTFVHQLGLTESIKPIIMKKYF